MPGPLDVGVATTAPLTVLSAPKFDVIAAGSAAAAAAVSDAVTSTVAVPPAGTVTWLGTVTVAPSWPRLASTDRV